MRDSFTGDNVDVRVDGKHADVERIQRVLDSAR